MARRHRLRRGRVLLYAAAVVDRVDRQQRLRVLLGAAVGAAGHLLVSSIVFLHFAAGGPVAEGLFDFA